MLTWKNVQKRSQRLILSLTSLTKDEIEKLIPIFEQEYEKQKQSWYQRKNRQRVTLLRHKFLQNLL
jgi:hypothetical protein